MDKEIVAVKKIMEVTYGKEEAVKWMVYWRTFFIAVAELFGYNNGEEWMVAHFLFKKKWWWFLYFSSNFSIKNTTIPFYFVFYDVMVSYQRSLFNLFKVTMLSRKTWGSSIMNWILLNQQLALSDSANHLLPDNNILIFY